MIWTNFKRVVKTGFISFWRNGIVSFASVFVMIATLFMVGSLMIADAFLTASLREIENKVDINVYFRVDATENEILVIKEKLESLPEAKEVEYVSRELALERFKDRNRENSLILQSLDELGGENPLRAALNVKAKEPSQYEGIANFLRSSAPDLLVGSQASIIESVNYLKNRVVIDRLDRVINGVERIGFFASLTLMVMAVLVTFNTIRLAIYNSREEIAIMKLVGANYSYIRGPFIISGIMYGVIAAVLALGLLYPASLWIDRATGGFFGSVNIETYYIDNFVQLALIIVISGVILGIISSGVAVRRYLRA